MRIFYIALCLGLISHGGLADIMPVSNTHTTERNEDRNTNTTVTITQTIVKPPISTHAPSTTPTPPPATADFKLVPMLRNRLPLNVSAADLLTDTQRHEVECIAWNLYFEVRGGQHKEQVAVAYVPINRIGKTDFGNDICTNVFQYNVVYGRHKHQFSWVANKFRTNWVIEQDAWEKMQNIAIDVYLHRVQDYGRGATYFQNAQLTSSWSVHTSKLALGNHLFWRG